MSRRGVGGAKSDASTLVPVVSSSGQLAATSHTTIVQRTCTYIHLYTYSGQLQWAASSSLAYHNSLHFSLNSGFFKT